MGGTRGGTVRDVLTPIESRLDDLSPVGRYVARDGLGCNADDRDKGAVLTC